MFNRAVSRLSRKRPPSGKLRPGPRAGCGGAPGAVGSRRASSPPAWPGRGWALPSRREPRPPAPLRFPPRLERRARRPGEEVRRPEEHSRLLGSDGEERRGTTPRTWVPCGLWLPRAARRAGPRAPEWPVRAASAGAEDARRAPGGGGPDRGHATGHPGLGCRRPQPRTLRSECGARGSTRVGGEGPLCRSRQGSADIRYQGFVLAVTLGQPALQFEATR